MQLFTQWSSWSQDIKRCNGWLLPSCWHAWLSWREQDPELYLSVTCEQPQFLMSPPADWLRCFVTVGGIGKKLVIGVYCEHTVSSKCVSRPALFSCGGLLSMVLIFTQLIAKPFGGLVMFSCCEWKHFKTVVWVFQISPWDTLKWPHQCCLSCQSLSAEMMHCVSVLWLLNSFIESLRWLASRSANTEH